MTRTALAVDLGSSSGRVIAGTLRDGRVEQEEIHRFAHEAEMRDGSLVWDVEVMWEEIQRGLRLALEQYPDASTVSVDTWGVDWAPLDADGNLVVLPRAYRDDRTVRTHEAFRAKLSDAAAWAATGIAPATINTANQLFAYLTEEPEAAERTERILLLPDYFTWKLSGVEGWSRSIASTGGLCNPGATQWADEVFDALGIPRSWVGDLTVEHTVAGQCTVEGLEQLTVVRGGAHDSACAVHALQRDEGVDGYFLSSGSWSVLGVVRDEPLLSDEARELGITNEARADAGVRPLFNITGMWILQECQRQWEDEGLESGIVPLLAAAEETESLGRTFDVDAPGFDRPGGMVQRVEEALGERDLTQGQIVRTICESLAERYARGIADLTAQTGSGIRQLNVVSGGSRNKLLCQLTADAIGVPVVAGPAEASVLGSLIAQFEVFDALGEPRNDVIARTAQTVTYEPRP